DVQSFLMRTSILQVVDIADSALVSEFTEERVRELIVTLEQVGLLGRRGRRGPEEYRYHPLVREFLEARLRAEEGDLALSELHRRVAYANEEANWRVAAHHYSAIKAWDDLQRVLVKSVGE